MPEDNSFTPGWLRGEIAAAIDNFSKLPYLSKDTLNT